MNLSGGNCRKLSLLISLLGEAKVLILDEPSTGMDAQVISLSNKQSKHYLWALLSDEQKERCILFSTHSMEEASLLSTRIGIMTNSRLRCEGTPHELILKHGSGYNCQIVYQKEKESQIVDKLKELYVDVKIIEIVGNQMRIELPKLKEQSEMFKDFEELYF